MESFVLQKRDRSQPIFTEMLTVLNKVSFRAVDSYFYLNLFNNSSKQETMLPKFLLADNSQEMPDMLYVVHNETPRFIVGSDIEDFTVNQTIYWIDEKPRDKDLIAQLLEEAEEFLEAELENQDNYFEDGEDE